MTTKVKVVARNNGDNIELWLIRRWREKKVTIYKSDNRFNEIALLIQQELNRIQDHNQWAFIDEWTFDGEWAFDD